MRIQSPYIKKKYKYIYKIKGRERKRMKIVKALILKF